MGRSELRKSCYLSLSATWQRPIDAVPCAKYLQFIRTPPSRPWTLERCGRRTWHSRQARSVAKLDLASFPTASGQQQQKGDRKVFTELLIHVCSHYAISMPWRASWVEGHVPSHVVLGPLALLFALRVDVSSSFTGSYACRGSADLYVLCAALMTLKILRPIPGDE